MRAPQTRMPRPGNRRMALTPRGLSTSCCDVVDVEAQLDCAAHDLVGGRLEHAALDVGARVDAERVTARRHVLQRAALRIGDLYPGIVECGVCELSVRLVADRRVEIAMLRLESMTAKRKRLSSQWVITSPARGRHRSEELGIDQGDLAIRVEGQRIEALRFVALAGDRIALVVVDPSIWRIVTPFSSTAPSLASGESLFVSSGPLA